MDRTAAFFDIDGTIFRNSLMIEHFKKLIKYEVINPAIWYTDVKDLYLKWEGRYGEFDPYLETLADVYLEALKGKNKFDIDFIAKQVIKIEGDMVYKYSRDRIEWHKDKGHKIFFISGSPDFLVSKMANKYGATDYRGTLYKIDEDGNFTGEVDKMWDSASKEKTLNDLIDSYKVDLDNSYAYGDTTGDCSMLRIVGNPIAINPNKSFLESIKKDDYLSENTLIVVERKNVIYKLDASVDIIED